MGCRAHPVDSNSQPGKIDKPSSTNATMCQEVFIEQSSIVVDSELVVVLAWIYVSLLSVCSAPHPHDTDGLITLELNSLGLYPVEVPLLLSIQRARVMG